MSLNKYSSSNNQNLKINNDNQSSSNNKFMINQTSSFNIQSKTTKNNNYFCLKKNNNKKYISYKCNPIKKDINKNILIRYNTPSAKQKINSFLDNNITFFNKEKNIDNNQIYELKFKNILNNNHLIRSKSYNNNKVEFIDKFGKEIVNKFSPRIKKKIQRIYKILESSNFPKPINSYKLNKISNITNYNSQINKNKEKYHNNQKNCLRKYYSYFNNENPMKYNDKNVKILETNKLSDINGCENYSYKDKKEESYSGNYNCQKIDKKNLYQNYISKEKIKIEEKDDKINMISDSNNTNNNNLKLNKNLINYLNKYKGEQKKIMERCLSTLNFNYADDNYNYNFQINYNDLDNSNNNQNNNLKSTNNYIKDKIINENKNNNSNHRNKNEKNYGTIFEDNKENFNNINLNYINGNKTYEKKTNKDGIKKDFNYKKINYKKYNINKDKNIQLNIFNFDEDIQFTNKRLYFPISKGNNKYYHNKFLYFGDIDNDYSLIKKPKIKSELLLTKIPRHTKINENKKNKYTINIPRLFNYQKKNITNVFKKDLNNNIGLQSKKSAIMPPNNYSNEFIKKVFTSFYIKNI